VFTSHQNRMAAIGRKPILKASLSRSSLILSLSSSWVSLRTPATDAARPIARSSRDILGVIHRLTPMLYNAPAVNYA
jgi:hypothetical protein